MLMSVNTYPPVNEGLLPFRIIGMTFVGTHLNKYNGKMQKLMWVEVEFPTELRDDGTPHTLWKRMTAAWISNRHLGHLPRRCSAAS